MSKPIQPSLTKMHKSPACLPVSVTKISGYGVASGTSRPCPEVAQPAPTDANPVRLHHNLAEGK